MTTMVEKKHETPVRARRELARPTTSSRRITIVCRGSRAVARGRGSGEGGGRAGGSGGRCRAVVLRDNSGSIVYWPRNDFRNLQSYSCKSNFMYTLLKIT